MSFLLKISALPLLIFSLYLSPKDAQALNFPKAKIHSSNSVSLPTFPRCPNPGGTLVVSYPEGWHWIVGDPQLKWGSDSVYHIGNNNYVQCYCPLNGVTDQGIQTNWLKVSNITETEKNQLLAQGWILVGNGADFGLPQGAYLAKNSFFTCAKCLPVVKISSSGVKSQIQIKSSGNSTVSVSQNSQLNSSTQTQITNIDQKF